MYREVYSNNCTYSFRKNLSKPGVIKVYKVESLSHVSRAGFPIRLVGPVSGLRSPVRKRAIRKQYSGLSGFAEPC